MRWTASWVVSFIGPSTSQGGHQTSQILCSDTGTGPHTNWLQHSLICDITSPQSMNWAIYDSSGKIP